MFFDGHYTSWRQKRYLFLLNLLGEKYFCGKTMLELGAGCGHFGQMFYEIGAKVTCIEGRSINVERGQKIHPHLKFIERDLERFDSHGFLSDIVLDTGLFYHLLSVDRHLANTAESFRDLWILEGEVSNSDDPYFFVQTTEDSMGLDSSISGFGIRPSAAHVERVLGSLNIYFQRYDDESINCDGHNYSWKVTNKPDKSLGWWENGLRRLWICKHK